MTQVETTQRCPLMAHGWHSKGPGRKSLTVIRSYLASFFSLTDLLPWLYTKLARG